MKDVLVLCPQERDLMGSAQRASKAASGFGSKARISTSSRSSTRRLPRKSWKGRPPTASSVRRICRRSSPRSSRSGAIYLGRRRKRSSRASTSRPPGRRSSAPLRRRRPGSRRSTGGFPSTPVLRQAGGRASLAERLPDRRALRARGHPENERYTDRYAQIAALAPGEPPMCTASSWRSSSPAKR